MSLHSALTESSPADFVGESTNIGSPSSESSSASCDVNTAIVCPSSDGTIYTLISKINHETI